MHTAFQVIVEAPGGVNLTQAPFQSYQNQISHPNDYQVSQQLGRDMRQASVQAFLFISARCPHQLINFAAFEVGVFKAQHQQYVFNQQSWMCISNQSQVEFKRTQLNQTEKWVF